ncbi:MAG TPA: type II toxin-antitoxin system Phd/YefM family antitoxin [bacterium]
MKTVPLSEAKARLSALLDAVEGHDEEIVITRNGRAAAVLVSPDDFESWKETAAVRADADLVAEIRRGLSALKRGKATLYTLDELFAD